MIATIFSEKKLHTESCAFVEWKKEFRSMGTCGEKAMGKIGKDPACKEHFEYACALHRLDRNVER